MHFYHLKFNSAPSFPLFISLKFCEKNYCALESLPSLCDVQFMNVKLIVSNVNNYFINVTLTYLVKQW